MTLLSIQLFWLVIVTVLTSSAIVENTYNFINHCSYPRNHPSAGVDGIFFSRRA